MSKHIKKAKVFLCSVDHYTNKNKKHKTAGTYLVGAKTAKEAFSILQKAIGFGHIIVWGERTESYTLYKKLLHGQVIKYVGSAGSNEYLFGDVKHDTASRNNDEKEIYRKHNRNANIKKTCDSIIGNYESIDYLMQNMI